MTINSAKDIISYAKERDFGNGIKSVKEVIEIIDSVDILGQTGFKQKVMELIISDNDNLTEEEKLNMEAFKKDLNTIIEQEDFFLKKFVINNNAISEEGKKFLKLIISSIEGPWSAELFYKIPCVIGTRIPDFQHVKSVEENNGKITIKHANGEAYYYIETFKKKKKNISKIISDKISNIFSNNDIDKENPVDKKYPSLNEYDPKVIQNLFKDLFNPLSNTPTRRKLLESIDEEEQKFLDGLGKKILLFQPLSTEEESRRDQILERILPQIINLNHIDLSSINGKRVKKNKF